MGKDAKPVRLAITFQENSYAISQLRLVSHFMKQAAAVRRQGIVKSCADWVSFTTGLLEAIHSAKPPGLASGAYTQMWLPHSL